MSLRVHSRPAAGCRDGHVAIDAPRRRSDSTGSRRQGVFVASKQASGSSPRSTGGKGGSGKSKSRRPRRTAATSDRHELYELSVQAPENEVRFIDKVWRKVRGRKAESFREDFAGTMYLASTWVRHRKENTAIAVDLDDEVQSWGMRRHIDPLPEEARRRVDVRLEDVRTVKCPRVDCIGAFNFSYYLFKTRPELIAYFKAARRGLKADGIFLLDAYGGSESFEEGEEDRPLKGFTYVWDTGRYNPITGDVVTRIHFRFPDGSEIDSAFVYEWRLWTLPEIQECLREAGFGTVEVWWEGTTKDGEGDGKFKPTREGDACQGWIAYLVARD